MTFNDFISMQDHKEAIINMRYLEIEITPECLTNRGVNLEMLGEDVQEICGETSRRIYEYIYEKPTPAYWIRNFIMIGGDGRTFPQELFWNKFIDALVAQFKYTISPIGGDIREQSGVDMANGFILDEQTLRSQRRDLSPKALGILNSLNLIKDIDVSKSFCMREYYAH